MTVIESKLLNILFSAYILAGPTRGIGDFDFIECPFSTDFVASAFLHEHLERSYTLPRENPFKRGKADGNVNGVLERFKRLVDAYKSAYSGYNNTAIYMASFTVLSGVLCVVKIEFENGREKIRFFCFFGKINIKIFA